MEVVDIKRSDMARLAIRIFLVRRNPPSAYVLWKTTSSSTYLEQQTFSEGLNLYICVVGALIFDTELWLSGNFFI